jgi:RHS repeat-associated protein
LGLSSQGPNNGLPHQDWFIRDNEGTLVSMMDRDDSSKDLFYLFDGLGSVAATTDQAGNVVRRYSYEPYGREIGALATDPNPWRFASGYFDRVTGTLKFGTRYYLPDVGRWTQRDPLMGAATDPMSLNPYSYAGCNPVSFVDPSGRASEDGSCALLSALSGVWTGSNISLIKQLMAVPHPAAKAFVAGVNLLISATIVVDWLITCVP